MEVCAITGIIVFVFIIYYLVKDSKNSKRSIAESNTYKTENAIFHAVSDANTSLDLPFEQIKDLGVRVLFFSGKEFQFTVSKVAFLTKKMFCINTDRPYFDHLGALNSDYQFIAEPNTIDVTTTKNKSMVGRTVVGAALGGGVGAVIGAASSASNNGMKSVTTTLKTGDNTLKIKYKIGLPLPIKYVLVRSDIVEKLGDLPFPEYFDYTSEYKIYSTTHIGGVQSSTIIDYLKKAVLIDP